MPRPKMKIFKKNFLQISFLFFSHPKPLKHLRKVENKFLTFFKGVLKKPKSAYAAPENENFQKKIFQNFFLFFFHPKPLKHLRKVENSFLTFFWRGVKKNLKVPMPRPKMKIFKKKNFQIFFLFFSHPKPLKHLRKVENNFLTFFWRGVKKKHKSAYAPPENENFQKKIFPDFFFFFFPPKTIETS